MGFLNELNEFRKRLLGWLWIWLIVSLFIFSFGPQEINIFGRHLFLPLPSTASSFSVSVFEKIKNDLVPQNVKLIVINPLSAFSAQLIIALALGFFLTFPIFLSKILGFVFPAFYEREKKIAVKILFPSLILFFLGCLFAYFLLLPQTFKILYFFATPLGVLSYLEINSFLIWVFGLMFASGLMFLLPLVMVLLSALGIVEPNLWKEKWHYAFASFLIISAIITPDGTGITMILLTLPLTLLYFLSYTVAKVRKKEKTKFGYQNPK